MDWINHEGVFREHDFTTFEYDDGNYGPVGNGDRARAQWITREIDDAVSNSLAIPMHYSSCRDRISRD